MKFGTGAVAFFAGVSLMTSASAVDIQNDDEVDYRITVLEGEASQPFMLRAITTLAKICQGRCTLRVEGVGEVQADKQELVRIQDRVISKQPKKN